MSPPTLLLADCSSTIRRMADPNGVRRITSRELSDKLEVLRAEQRVEHVKTRSWVIVSAALTGGSTIGLKIAAVLGATNWQPF